MTQVHSADHKTHPSNTRAAADAVVSDEWWFGFEQEYFFTNKDGSPLGWEEGEPRPQETTIVVLELIMFQEEKFLKLIWMLV